MQHQVNLRGTKKPHDTIRDMIAASSHVLSCISRGGTQWVYGGRLFVVSARTNKRLALTSLGVPGRPLGNPPVVGFNLGHGGVPRGRSVDGQLSDTPLRAGLFNFMLCVPVLNSRGLSPWLFGVRFGPLFHRHIGG